MTFEQNKWWNFALLLQNSFKTLRKDVFFEMLKDKAIQENTKQIAGYIEESFSLEEAKILAEIFTEIENKKRTDLRIK